MPRLKETLKLLRGATKFFFWWSEAALTRLYFSFEPRYVKVSRQMPLAALPLPYHHRHLR